MSIFKKSKVSSQLSDELIKRSAIFLRKLVRYEERNLLTKELSSWLDAAILLANCDESPDIDWLIGRLTRRQLALQACAPIKKPDLYEEFSVAEQPKVISYLLGRDLTLSTLEGGVRDAVEGYLTECERSRL
jgi:hypothetical protein